PEGGYHSIPHRLHGDGLVVTGDAAGAVDVATLKGIHYAMWSGIYAARSIHAALSKDDTSADALASYDTSLHQRLRASPLYANRNMRLAFKSGFYGGGVRAGLMQLTRGGFPGRRISTPPDAEEPRTARAGIDPTPDGSLTYGKVDAVFRSGNATRDDIPSHLVVGADVSPQMAEVYERLCPAGVYEEKDGKLVVNAPNCVDCKATDIIGPRWTPREGGSGPTYKRM
ncbi:MAG: 4Fe-4S dicluster domain-containing protein, partial [Gemmatimonadota bacterium]|nr:4Fe-4S dicluster domain-containing protein [Gemmatimonadota bacterium]